MTRIDFDDVTTELVAVRQSIQHLQCHGGQTPAAHVRELAVAVDKLTISVYNGLALIRDKLDSDRR